MSVINDNCVRKFITGNSVPGQWLSAVMNIIEQLQIRALIHTNSLLSSVFF